MPNREMPSAPREGWRGGRRGFLADAGLGFGGLALGAMLHRDGVRASDEAGWVPTGVPPLTPRARNVIWLFMLGGVSHVESFDPKPALNKHAGQTINETPYADAIVKSPHYRRNVRDFAGTPRDLMATVYPLQIGYAPRGQSGIEMADWWPHIGAQADSLAVVRSVWCTDNDHAAQYEFNTGHHIFDGYHPSLGSWVHWGLGSLNDNLPSFVVLGDGPDVCCGGRGAHSASYLGPAHAGVQLKVDPANPLPYGKPPAEVSSTEQAAQFELLRRLNQSALTQGDDATLRARMQSYELAYRMQRSVPEVVRLEAETQATQELYGLNSPVTGPFARLCLTARRLVERGVRFVQVYHGNGGGGGWDAHSDLKGNHGKLAPQVDQPIGALLADLARSGLLEETIVVFASEFGRTPGSERSTGRDHHPYGFSVWLAGGGLKAGVVHGATDELGFHAVTDRHYVTDIHATVLHQLGLDHRRLEIPGRKRLDIKLGQVISDIIA